MPTAAPKLCVCGKAIPSGQRCPCRVKATKIRNAQFERSRPSARQRGYDSEWDKARKAFLAKHPFCRRCGAPAKVVDHIIPHRGDKAVFWDRANWQPLCTPCHSGAKQKHERRLHGEKP